MGVIKDRTGELRINRQGVNMWILKYINSNNIIIQFESGYVTKDKYVNFTDGNVRDPYIPTVYGHGYIGYGKHKTVENGKHTRMYKIWTSMLQRCYSGKDYVSTYNDCTVCKAWLNFQNFAQWYEENYYEIEGQRMHLDKDILYQGNKIYSPHTCVFVPQNINLMFRKNVHTPRRKILAIAEEYKEYIPYILYDRLLEYCD